MTSEKYGLKHSLFDDLEYTYPIIQREDELDKIASFINMSAHGSRTFLIIGDFGCGKTLLLSKIRKDFKDKKFTNSEKSIITSMRLIEGEAEAKIGFSFVTRLFKSMGYRKINQIIKKTPSLDEAKFDTNFQKIVAGLRAQKQIAYDWLCGKPLPPKDRTDLGLSQNLTKSNDAIEVFFQFLKLLKCSEIENVFLLIDEFEYVVTTYSQKQVDSLLYLFKDIYDKYAEAKDDMAKVIFIIAMTPGCWSKLTHMEEHQGGGSIIPWSERVSPKINQIQLLPLEESGTEELLLNRIEKNRIQHEEDLPTKTWPFVHPEFFKIIHDKGKGIPRKSLKLCDYVFECGLEDDVEEFDGTYTKRILDNI